MLLLALHSLQWSVSESLLSCNRAFDALLGCGLTKATLFSYLSQEIAVTSIYLWLFKSRVGRIRNVKFEGIRRL